MQRASRRRLTRSRIAAPGSRRAPKPSARFAARWSSSRAFTTSRRCASRTASRSRALRPLIVRAAVLGAIGPMSADLRREIDDAMTSNGPPIDRELLKGMLAIAETEARPIVAMRDVDDPIERYNRAWTLAYGGRFDEAYGEAERLGRDPAYGGLGVAIVYHFARYYDDERESEMARQLAENLPEEPWPWIELGKARVRREELAIRN